MSYTLAMQQSLVHGCISKRRRKLAAKCTLSSSIVWTEAMQSLSVIFCGHSTPVSAIAALCRPHSACPALLFTPGVPPPCKVSPVWPWDGGELKYEPPSPVSSSAQQDARAGLFPAAGWVSVGLWMSAVLEQPHLPQQRAHQCHSASDTSRKYCFIFCTVDCHS